jgi:hypothetical protein
MSAIGPRPSVYGSMAARMAPPLLVPQHRVETAPLRDRLTAALSRFPRTTSGLASELDVKEIHVIHTLANMQREGVCASDPIPTEGRRGQLWRLA